MTRSDPLSCARNRFCMYLRCTHGDRDIAFEIDAAEAARKGEGNV